MNFDSFNQYVKVFNNIFSKTGTGQFKEQLCYLVEELGEFTQAVNKDDGELALKEWADVMYVLMGMTYVMGYSETDVQDALQKVAVKNDKKVNEALYSGKIKLSSTGKVLK